MKTTPCDFKRCQFQKFQSFQPFSSFTHSYPSPLQTFHRCAPFQSFNSLGGTKNKGTEKSHRHRDACTAGRRGRGQILCQLPSLVRSGNHFQIIVQFRSFAGCAAQARGRKRGVLEFKLRDLSRYPMSEGSVRQSCLDPPRGSVRISAADLRSNPPDTDYRVDPS